MSKPILCLDFDGVLHSYTSGWKGADVIPDPPVLGAIGFLREAVKHFRVAIFSSRSGQEGGIRAMQQWLATHADKDGAMTLWEIDIEWPTEKPSAMVTIDDRALTFTGKWPSIETLLAFKPWNKAPPQQPKFLLLPDGNSVCVNPGGHFDGWLMRKHPDGQWVSVQRLDVAEFVEPEWMRGL